MVSGPAAERAMVTKRQFHQIPQLDCDWPRPASRQAAEAASSTRRLAEITRHFGCPVVCVNCLDVNDGREPTQQTLLSSSTFSSTQSGHRETPRLRIVVWVVQPSEAE